MQLDKYQKAVITYMNNMLVLASAGTGKTLCIVEKIKYLKKNYNANDNDFLIITFTNEMVNNIKNKVNNIPVYTFHKLALNIIKKKYQLYHDSNLFFIIDEFFNAIITDYEKRKLKKYFMFFNYNEMIKSKSFLTFKKLIFTYIKLIKTNNLDLNYLKKIYKNDKNIFFITIIIKIYVIYENEKKSQNKIDLDDLIILASQTKRKFTYKYIFVDEFQDTSQIRFNLIKNIYDNSSAKLFLFGDDYQSIYRFTGCNLNILLNIKNYIPNIEIKLLKKTYRNSQELINVANRFIMKNKKQILKKMNSDIHIKNPIEIIYYTNPHKAFDKLIKNIDMTNYLILGRNKNDLLLYTGKPEKYNYLTVHKAKGLEADNIILINLSNDIYGFPNKIKNYYLINDINCFEEIKYAEERRLFYVALTRARKKIYILVPFSNPSIFVNEIKK